MLTLVHPVFSFLTRWNLKAPWVDGTDGWFPNVIEGFLKYILSLYPLLNLGSWSFSLGSCLLNLGSWVFNLGSWLFNLGSWSLNPGSCLLNLGSRLLNLGSWLLNLGSWLFNLGSLKCRWQDWGLGFPKT